jgi:ketosteroid isomerase-like protein
VSTAPGTNIERLAAALMPFADGDLVILFRSEGAMQDLRRTLGEIAAPDLVTLMIGADHGLTGSFRGTEGFIEAWRDYTQTFTSLHSEITDLREIGPDLVYGETRQVGTTATAGIEIEYEPAAIFRFSDGRLEQAEFHLDRDVARRAVGLDPDRRSDG